MPRLELLEHRLQPAVTLGSAANFAVLGLVGADIHNNNVTIVGNEGVSQGGRLTNAGHSTIAGDVDEFKKNQYSGPGKLGGSLVVNSTMMTQADLDALDAASQTAALTPTQTFGNINKPTTIVGNGGVNVISIHGDIHSSLTLSGSPNDIFYINVSGNLDLNGKETLGLAGGVTASHVLYNFTGRHGNISTHAGNAINGTFLGLKYNVSLDGVLNGAVIGGGDINLAHASVNQVSFVATPPTLPATIAGFAFDSNGFALGGVTVTLTDSTGNALGHATSGADGSFTITGVPPGTGYTLAATLSGYRTISATAGADKSGADGTSGAATVTGISLTSGDVGVNYNFALQSRV